MTEDAKQRTIEGLVVTDRETLKSILREVLDEEGVTGFLKRAKKWGRDYKGDDWWLEFRAHVVQLIKRNAVISYGDLDQDRYFSIKAKILQQTQWNRAVDQHLVPNHPAGNEDLDIVTFTVSPRGARHVTFRTWLHCAIAKAAEGRKDPALVQEVRARYDAEVPCEACRRGRRTSAATYSVRQPRSSEHTPPTEDLLNDEERSSVHRFRQRGAEALSRAREAISWQRELSKNGSPPI